MTRLPGWEGRLYALLERKRFEGFEWGEHDCCTWAASAVAAVSGQQISFPGPYTSARQALRVVRALGGLPAAVTAALGSEPMPASHAQRGDIVLLRQPRSFDGHALAVCFGEFAYAPGEDCLVAIRMTAAEVLGAWHIGIEP